MRRGAAHRNNLEGKFEKACRLRTTSFPGGIRCFGEPGPYREHEQLDSSPRRGRRRFRHERRHQDAAEDQAAELYRVLLLNDDYTPMEFVVHVLERFFKKGREEATRIMLHVHQHGVGECGVFTYEVAETKVTQVMDFARKHQHPLQCVMEKK